MIGELHVEIVRSEQMSDLAHITLWEFWGTILKRQVVTGVMTWGAAQELARRVNQGSEK